MAAFRCVIAPSFGDIFAANAGKNGLLLLSMPSTQSAPLRTRAPIHIDLRAQTIRTDGTTIPFDIAPLHKRMLLQGLDDIGLTLAHEADLDAWTATDAKLRPWATPA